MYMLHRRKQNISLKIDEKVEFTVCSWQQSVIQITEQKVREKVSPQCVCLDTQEPEQRGRLWVAFSCCRLHEAFRLLTGVGQKKLLKNCMR